MKMQPDRVKAIRDTLSNASVSVGRFLWDADASIALSDLLHGTSLGGRLLELAGRSVLVAAQDQLAAALALIELDGVARRLVICPPDLPSEHLPAVGAKARAETIAPDHDGSDDTSGVPLRVICQGTAIPADETPVTCARTGWGRLT